MKTKIKQRIRQIQRGEVPEGYIRTKAGIMPYDWFKFKKYKAKNIFKSITNKKHNGKFEVLSVTQTEGIIPRSQLDIDIKFDKDSVKGYKKVDYGDFVISLRSFQGGIEFSEYEGVVSPAYTVLKPKLPICDGYYRAYMKTDDFINRLNKSTYGIRDGKQIGFEDFGNMTIHYPPLAEQKKIAEILFTQDKLIELNQRKIEELKKLKKYYLSKMFPQKGSDVPEIRFKGFTEPWEQREFKDVIEDYAEKSTVEDQYPVLTSSQQKGIVLQDDYFSGDRVSQLGNLGYFIIPKGYFTYRSRSDNDIFVFNRNDCIDMGIISYFYPVFKPKGVDSDFLLRRLNYGLEIQLRIASEGTGQHVLSLKKFKSMSALFPTFEEQQSIGAYFNNIDNLITLHQHKCEELKKYKKALMQLLLTGIVRVKT